MSMRKVLFASTCALALVAAVWIAGLSYLTRSHPAFVGGAPADLAADTVAIPNGKGAAIAGWYSASPQDRGALLLVHGIKANRLSQVDRFRFYRANGFSVLAIDLQAHGESGGSRTTFGVLESLDVIAAAAWLRKEQPSQSIAVVGTSLGGAAALIAGSKLDADALIVEAVYGNIELATSNRLRRRLGPAGAYLTPILVWSAELWLGISRDALDPAKAAGLGRLPTLILAGGADSVAPPIEAEAIYAASTAPKYIHIFERAGHVDFQRFSPQEYAATVLPFLEAHLRNSKADQ